MSNSLSHSAQLVPSTSQSYHLRNELDGNHHLSNTSANKDGADGTFVIANSSTNKIDNVQQKSQSHQNHLFSPSTLPEFTPEQSSAFIKSNEKYCRRRDGSLSEEERQTSPSLVHRHSNSHSLLMSSPTRGGGGHQNSHNTKLLSLLDSNQDCDNVLTSASSPYKASTTENLMSSFGFGYPGSTSIVSGFTNNGINAFSAVSSRKLPPEGNDISMYSINNPSQTQETFSPSPTIDILQNSPTLTSSLAATSTRIDPSPLQSLMENDGNISSYPSNKEILSSSLSSSMMKHQNDESSPISPSSLNLQSQHHLQINSSNVGGNAMNDASFPSSSDMENQLHLINDRPSPSTLPVSSSSSAYPYFTSPNVDLSAQYYGSYSSNDGMFSSKTLQPSRSRNLKSRSHTGKIDNLVFYQELIWWWFSISFNAQVHTI